MLIAVLLLALALNTASAAPTPAQALSPQTTATSPTADAAAQPPPALTSVKVTEIARGSRRLQEWIANHPIARTTAVRDPKTDLWTVSFIDAADKIQGVVLVSDTSSRITETRTGPQVAWQMARGYKGAFGRSLTEPQIWIPLFMLFLVPLLRWRRLIAWRTLDLLALCGFGLSLVWFNRGEIFTSVPLTYPPLAYLGLRLAWIGVRGRRAASPDVDDEAAAPPRLRPGLDSWCPTWLLVSLMLVAVGLRIGLNAFDSSVIDVGYAGVIGADRISEGQTPYGTTPSDCSRCDTYGPVTYLAYVPFEAVFPWVGRWNDLPAGHGAAILFDLLALAGIIVLGWRIGGRHLAAGLGLAWAAFPFTAYALESNANDSLVAAALVWGLVVAHRPLGRGISLGLAILAKFTPAILLVLWSRHPFPRASRGVGRLRYAAGLALVAVASGWVILLDGDDGVRAFWSRTLGFQFGRDSPFSLWGQYTWLRPVQIALVVIVALGALVLIARPRRLDPRSFAALSGALIVGVQLSMTHWFYLYIPWFLPFALVAMVPDWPPRPPVPAEVRPEEAPEPALAGATA
jgi:hypothetical protein